MVSRFKHDVLPALTPLIGSYIEGGFANNEMRDDIPSYDSSRLHSLASQPQQAFKRSKLQASELSLISSVLRCFEGFFKACNRSLAELIPAVGTLILPFLGEDGETGEACEKALEQLVRIDCDALWRPLVQLGGKTFPPARPWMQRSPLSKANRTSREDEPILSDKHSSSIVTRARRLVALVESLPEQAL